MGSFPGCGVRGTRRANLQRNLRAAQFRQTSPGTRCKKCRGATREGTVEVIQNGSAGKHLGVMPESLLCGSVEWGDSNEETSMKIRKGGVSAGKRSVTKGKEAVAKSCLDYIMARKARANITGSRLRLKN